MPESTAYELSKLFSQLTGRKVQFSLAAAAAPQTTIRQMYGIYQVLPHDVVVVKADLPLLGSFGGLLVGLPASAISEHLRVTPMEELLRDAIYEVLNITSAAIAAEGRAIFTRMVQDPLQLDDAASAAFKKPDHTRYFNVLVDGYQGGRFSIFSQIHVASCAAV